MEHIKVTGVDKETINTCYVTNDNRKLLGIVTVRTLLLAEENSLMQDIMTEDVISALTTEDREAVAHSFTKYDLSAMPVVDEENRLVGIVTVDDVMDVIEEETTEDFSKMAAIAPSEDEYFKTSVFSHARNRIVWLLVLMLSSTLTGLVISKYEAAFAAKMNVCGVIVNVGSSLIL